MLFRSLSIEFSALGHAWIVDPGSYVYNLDREARHRFRSTAAHSTVVIDGSEQNAIAMDQPFVSSNDARPRLIDIHLGADTDSVAAEHYGYSPIVHRRSVRLDSDTRVVVVTDELTGPPVKNAYVTLQIAPGVSAARDGDVLVLSTKCDDERVAVDAPSGTEFEITESAFARHYGSIEPSLTVRWCLKQNKSTFCLVPVAANEPLEDRLSAARRLVQHKD